MIIRNSSNYQMGNIYRNKEWKVKIETSFFHISGMVDGFS